MGYSDSKGELLSHSIPVTLTPLQGHVLVYEGMYTYGDIVNELNEAILPKGSWVSKDEIELLRDRKKFGESLFMSLGLTCSSRLGGAIDTAMQGALQDAKQFEAFKAVVFENERYARKLLLSIWDRSSAGSHSLLKKIEQIFSSVSSFAGLFRYMALSDVTDDVTFGHSFNVSVLCSMFGQWLGYRKSDVKKLGLTGMLHDLGKLDVPAAIINKPGPLTTEEFKIVQQHPIFGFRAVEHSSLDVEIRKGILMHHEKMDGSGYPSGIDYSKITEVASIVAISDIWDAMLSNRSYRGKMSPFQIIEMFENNAFGFLHPQFLLVFLQHVSFAYLGCAVRLNDGRIGIVVCLNPSRLSKPLIVLEDDSVIDLSKNPNLSIVELL